MVPNFAPYAVAWFLSGMVGFHLALYGLLQARSDLAAILARTDDAMVIHQAKVILRSWRIRTTVQALVLLLSILTILTGRSSLPATAPGVAMFALECRRWIFFLISVLIAAQSYIDIKDYPGDGR